MTVRQDCAIGGAFEMKKLKALQNPFLLVAEGFIAGAVLFFATTPGVSHAMLAKVPHSVSAAVHR
jgi:hypothetical protein